MRENARGGPLDRPATYQIKFRGRLDADWSQWFGGMTLSLALDDRGQPITTLTGPLPDQAALHGLLGRIRDLSLPLLLVLRLEPGTDRERTD